MHSRFLSGTVQVNTLNKDFRREYARGTDEGKLAYSATMIGKETIAYNDKSNAVNEFLEKLLSFMFEARARIGMSSAAPGKRPRGRPRKDTGLSAAPARNRTTRKTRQLPLSLS